MAKGELLSDPDRAAQRLTRHPLFAPIVRLARTISGRLGADFTRRLLTALVAAPLVLAAVIYGGAIMNAAVILVVAICAVELYTMIKPDRSALRVAFFLLGLLYVGFPFVLISRLAYHPNGREWLAILLLSNWATDGFALIGGRLFGRTKLAPSISPGKTVEGVLIGIIAGIVAAVGFGAWWLNLSVDNGVVIGLLIALPTVVGDLFESYVKRQFHVKDTSGVLPGHGGLLDRVDGLVLATIGLTVALLVI